MCHIVWEYFFHQELLCLIQVHSDAFFGRMREAELLEAIISSVQEWENCLQKLLEPILRSHTNQKYSSSSLLSALKVKYLAKLFYISCKLAYPARRSIMVNLDKQIAGTMEIQQDENCQLALALSVNAWRMQATSIMESSTKPSYRTVCRALKEVKLDDDCVTARWHDNKLS